MKRYFITMGMLLLSALLFSCSTGQQKETARERFISTARGSSTIFDDDKAFARDRALDDAKNNLVQKVLGVTVSSRTLVKDFALVSKLIKARSYGLVRDITILSEKIDGTLYRVTIRGRVEPQAVQEAVDDTLIRYGRPRFLVIVQETILGKPSSPDDNTTTSLVQEIMSNSGFDFIDPRFIKGLSKKEKKIISTAGTPPLDYLQVLLEKNNAEVIITGSVKTIDQSSVLGENTKMKSHQALVRLRAVDAYTGKILAAKSIQLPGIQITDQAASRVAIKNCLEKIMGREDRDSGKFSMGPFIKQIVHRFTRGATERQITITIQGLSGYEEVRKFRNALGNRIRGVDSVISRKLRKGTAEIEVVFAGKTAGFLDELKAKSKKMGYHITIVESYPNRAKLRVSPAVP
jgi:hypothetical protein